MATTLLNKDLFYRDPTTFSIPNQGVAKVVEPSTPEEWQTLAYELESFVCEGEYARGLERVLSTFLEHLDRPSQPAVWVSGFYGSGKSHFARVLEFLWRDVEFPSGERARNRVHLPDSIHELLRELTIQGRRRGGLWSAAGTLGAAAASTNAVRLGMLGIVFGSAGLPPVYGRAQFLLFLKQQGVYDQVRAAVEVRERNFDAEASNYLVSPSLHAAVLEALPNLAPSPAAVGELLKAQFPPVQDVSDDEFVDAIEAVLRLRAAENGKPGDLPLTLIVFDELQQFIGDDAARTLQVQNVVEAVTSRFKSSVLFLATGQSALGSTTQLQKLQGRFTVRVTLDNTDVERVVREVVLRKRPERIPDLEAVLERASGEIARQLRETNIAVTPDQWDELVPDYPLLPSRRAFWEAALRAVDSAGTAGQLRTQLRIVQEATKAVAQEPVGHVIPGDAIFDQLRGEMLQSGVLLQETNKIIADLDDGSADGTLKARLCKLAFLIDRLPTEGAKPTGLRATADNLADLLVVDFDGGGAALRARVPGLLADLAERGVLMKVDDEYRVQTREGMQWQRLYQEWLARTQADDARIADERTARLRAAVDKHIGKLAVAHGASKEARPVELHWGMDAPSGGSGKIPVWVRDEWSVAEKSVRDEARHLGTDSPVVSVSLPQRRPDAIKAAIARYVAAEETLNAKGVPTTNEGQQARAAVVSQRDAAAAQLDALIAEVVANARVFQGGGNEVAEGGPRDSAQRAAEAAVDRLYPRFKPADHAGWAKVFERAAKNPDALSEVGFKGDVKDNEVAAQILQFVGGAGKKGSAVRDHFGKPPFGWGRDAIDGALILLTATGLLRASRNGSPMLASDLTRQALGTVDFATEEIVITKAQMIRLRGLLQALGAPTATDDEARAVLRPTLNRLVELAAQAGGQPPLPAAPNTDTLQAILASNGNAQILATLNADEEIRRDHAAWTDAADKRPKREGRWQELQRMMRHGEGLPEMAEIKRQADAIAANRALLADPDQTLPLLKAAGDALRAAVRLGHQRLRATRDHAIAGLEKTPEWNELPDSTWQEILRHQGLGVLEEPKIGTDEELLRALEREPLAKLEERRIAIPQRVKLARQDAIRRLKPEHVSASAPPATISTHAELDAYLATWRETLAQHLDAGKAVVI